MEPGRQRVGEVKIFQALQSLIQFIITNRAGDVMPHHTAKTMRFGWSQFDFLDDRPADRRKDVSIVEAKWRKFVTAPSNFNGLAQSQLAAAGIFPKFLRVFIAIGRWLVQRILFLAQGGINGDDGFPRPIL